MLVLVAGITGNIGQELITSLTNRGHKVRGLARNPAKLSADQQEKLESFVTSTSYYDIPALDRACAGIDAIICAYAGGPELQLEGQLMLLRAAERAGVHRFIPATWNADWRHMTLGQHESYDPYLAFRRQAELSSCIKPVYIFTGVLLEVLLGAPGRVDFRPEHNGAWSPERKEMIIYGSGEAIYHFTTEQDCANFTAAIVERDDADEQQYWSVCSGALSLKEIARIYGEVRGCEVSIVRKGTCEDLRKSALAARASGEPRSFWAYIGWFYQLYNTDGTWALRNLDNGRLGVQSTGLRHFLEQNPDL